MGLYHAWIYVHVFNTTWFVWMTVSFILLANVFSPIIIWFMFRGKKILGSDGIFKVIYGSKKKHKHFG